MKPTIRETIDFFDARAGDWDSFATEEDFVRLRSILSRVSFDSGDEVLDVGCGTGIVIPFLIERGVEESRITAIDASGAMIDVLKSKHGNVRAVCGDFEDYRPGLSLFDKIIVFNAFPHFLSPQKVAQNAFSLLKDGGLLVIAHSMSRKALDEFHSRVDGVVSSHRLISDDEFRRTLASAGFREVVIEDADTFYLEAAK